MDGISQLGYALGGSNMSSGVNGTLHTGAGGPHPFGEEAYPWSENGDLDLDDMMFGPGGLFPGMDVASGYPGAGGDGAGFGGGGGLPHPGPEDVLPDELPSAIKSVFVVAYLLIIVISVLGNGMVILVVVRNAKMRTVTNTFLVSLAVSDLFIAALNMPFQLRFYLQNEWTLGAGLCKFTKYMQGVVVVSSILTLTGIAVDRFYAICHPLEARNVHTITRAAILITLFWLASFLLVLPQVFIQRIEPLLAFTWNGTEMSGMRMANICAEYFDDPRWRMSYTLFFYLVLYLLPVMTMFVTYGRICSTLWFRQPIGETAASPRDCNRRLQEKKRIVRMLVVIVVLFALSWFPFFTSQVYLLFHEHSHHDHSFRIMMAFFQLFGYSNCCINPIVYCFLNDSFQQHFIKTVCCCECFWEHARKGRRSSTTEIDRLQPMVSANSTHNSML